MELKVNATDWQRAAAFAVRLQVFVHERGLSLQAEFDDHDRDGTTYAVVYADQTPVATGRFQQLSTTTMRPGRIATLASQRGKGLGAQIIAALEQVGRDKGCQRSEIHSELTAQGFYAQLGYRPVGTPFTEDGVACILLQKQLV
ncbi:GNAT family N-acetyltransferase [Loigolactobacillus zhaoyuanensis]|uniref:GNAT family N-acetyltransferase n=1 Tax=Loigolactobacillus zhaoyuanensis TaxID=2486017 RepID=A0ABW8UCL0_9LACO|nr:GNAT family N-acetyltransferase [Loigolactobacillus zhaoyuanensis]